MMKSEDERFTAVISMNRLIIIISLLVITAFPHGGSCFRFNQVFEGATDFVSAPLRVGASFLGRDGDHDETTTTTTTTTTQTTSEKAVQESTNEKDDSNTEQIKDNFESQCLISRGANMQSAPKLYFFSSVDYCKDNFGCVAESVIPLGLDKSGAGFGDDPNDWLLDTETVQDLIVDSGSYNESAQTFILVHGFLASWNGDTWMCKLKDNILNRTRAANVFIVDWSGGSKPMMPIDYGAAVANTKYVGQLLAKFILTILEMTNQKDATRFHMIGHSLGAHISGFVGYALDDIRLGRITGLDPAGPCFSSGLHDNSTKLSETGKLSGGRRRLSAECAELVVAVHTDAGRFGLDENCGHYDIYVNGGSSQPTCVGQSPLDRVDNLLNLNLMDVINVWDIACPHGYSHQMTGGFIPFILETILRPLKLLGRDADEQVVQEESQQQQQQQYDFGPHDKQCYLMAHRCASWKAFKKGECGLTTEQQDLSHAIDTLAMNPDMDARQKAKAAEEAVAWTPIKEYISDLLSDKDDEHINKEEDQSTLQSSIIPERLSGESPNKQWKHFIKTGRSESSICAFTYQLVVAAEPADSQTKGKMYVEIPLDKEPGLVNKNRLVQVSHELKRDSRARTQLSKLSENLTHNSDQLDYYTALITFDAATSDECHAMVKMDKPKTNRKHWYLCQSLSYVDGARLWFSNDKSLERVKWVAIAYLSGSDASIRRDNSYLFEPNLNDMKKGKPGDAATGMKSRRGGLVNQLVGGVQGGVKCLVSSVNPLVDGTIGCDFGGVNLKYSSPLKLVKDKSKRRALQI